jgi:hypothetical protein
VVLKLTKRPPISFRVVDSDDRPLEGIELMPFLLSDSRRKAGLNFATLMGRGTRRTGPDGVVSFDWIPQWQTTPLQFMSFPSDRIRQIDQTVDPTTADEQPIKIVRDAFVPVSGVVRTTNGTPYRGVTVSAAATDAAPAGGLTTTDEEGRYQLLLEPGHSYLIVARCDEIGEASAPQDGVVVRRDEPLQNLTLQLRRAIRLLGTLGTNRMRSNRFSAQLRLVSDQDLPPAAANTPGASPVSARPGVYIELKPNSSGQFEVLVGPGSYELKPTAEEPATRFVLTDEDEYKVRIPPPPSTTPDRPGFARPGRRLD